MCACERFAQLWRRCNSDWHGANLPWRIVQALQHMSLELGMMGDVNVMRMKMAIEGLQVVAAAMMSLGIDVLQDAAVQKRMMRSFISLLKEDKEPSAPPVVGTCVVDGVIVSWPTNAALEGTVPSSSS